MDFERARVEPEGQAAFYVMLNPTQYSIEKSNQIAETAVPGLSAPILQYVHGNTRTLSAELYFDTFEDQTDVRQYTNKVYNLLAIDAHTHVPPICTVTWGSVSFKGVVDKVSGSFTLFLPNGTPVRAKLNVSLKEYIDVGVQVRKSPTQSADHRKSRVVLLGDTLTNIAFEEYGDAAKWRPIAEVNGLDNPLKLIPGRALHIPALDSGGKIARA
jgi:hypothetical protein